MFSLKVYNRPGYWRSLAFALLLLYGSFTGRTSVRNYKGKILAEYVKDARPRVMQMPCILDGFALLWIVLCGPPVRMDETHYYLQFEIHEEDYK